MKAVNESVYERGNKISVKCSAECGEVKKVLQCMSCGSFIKCKGTF